jgi:hypothetical protein
MGCRRRAVEVYPTPACDIRRLRGRHHFDFFRSRSASELSRFFDGGFWGRLVLQAAHSSAAVRHAVIALAALHQEFKAGLLPVSSGAVATTPWKCTYAIQEYGKAVHHLLRQISQEGDQSHDVALICIVLFISIEVLRGNDLAALHHLDGGLRMLNEGCDRKASFRTVESNIEEELLPMFARLDLEASIYLVLRPPNLDVPQSPFPVSYSSSPPMISCLAEASHSLNVVMNLVYRFTRLTADEFRYRSIGGIPLIVIGEQQFLLSRLFRWGCAFDSYLYNSWTVSASLSQQQRHQISLLQIHHKVCTSVLSCSLHAEETAYDAFNSVFARIVSLAGTVNTSITSLETASGRLQQTLDVSFSLETGIIQPLYWTAIKCRNGRTRRRAISLLRACPQEGVWVGAIQALAAERVIEIEEDGSLNGRMTSDGVKSSEDIPEWVRIHSVGMTLDRIGRTIEMAYQQRLNGSDGEWDETVKWLFW